MKTNENPVVGQIKYRTWLHRIFGFGVAFVPAEGFNMPLYGWAQIRPRWYWRMEWLRLALGFVWRQYEDGGPRWSWQDAKDIAYCVYPELRR